MANLVRIGTMRRASAVAAATLGLAVLAPVPASGQAPQPLTLAPGSPFQVQSVLDSQGCYPDPDQSCWVRNPTPDRAWNDQDDAYFRGQGYVDANSPATASAGLFADFAGGTSNVPHSVYVQVYSSANNVTVSLANDHGDAWQVGPPTKINNRYRWLFCTRDPVAIRGGVPVYEDPSLHWPVVPDSNYLPGSTIYGYAEPVVYTLTIAATSRDAKDVNAQFEIAASGPTWQAPRSITNCTS